MAWLLGVLGSLFLAGSLAVLYVRCIRERLFPKRFVPVQPGLVYRSARLTGCAIRRLHRRVGLRAIVDLAAAKRRSREAEFAAIEELGIRRYEVPGLGGEGIGDPEAYCRALRLICDPRNQPVLFHCAGGSKRTGTLDILHGIFVRGESLAEAADPARHFDCNILERPEHLAFLQAILPVVRDSFEEHFRAS